MLPKGNEVGTPCRSWWRNCALEPDSEISAIDRMEDGILPRALPSSLALLGEPSATSHWLAASLDKTIRLQLDPPADLRAMAALTGPDWIRKTGAG